MIIKTIDEFARSEGFNALRSKQNSDKVRFAVNENTWIAEPLRILEVDCKQVIERGELVVPGHAQIQGGRPTKIMGVDDLAFKIFSIRDNLQNELNNLSINSKVLSGESDARANELNSLVTSANQVINSLAHGQYQFAQDTLREGNNYQRF